ncbi:ribosome-inactivating family protein [Streptomyces sp. NPDC051907]|uniref:ribosome-inactivating family protein n=1 Tax=Streptomyces sp. NPDC051907 TaxID=3155284 RepID=UPI00342C0189
MSPMPLLRLAQLFARASRRLVGSVVALALSAGLVGLAAPAAQADPTQPNTVVDWNIDSLANGGRSAHDAYYGMIDRIHRVSGHDFRSAANIDESTTQLSRLIQIRVLRRGSQVVSLYFWANNLYLAGFYVPGTEQNPGRHYAFNDTWPDDFNHVLNLQTQATRLPWGGNYVSLPGGNNRTDDVINGPSLHNALLVLGGARSRLESGGDRGATEVGNALTLTIQATAEAARFGRIFDTVRGNIGTGTRTTMGTDNVVLQNNWSQISRWIYRASNDPAYPTHNALTLNGVAYRALHALLTHLLYVELHSGSRPR